MLLFDSNGALCKQNRDWVAAGDPLYFAVAPGAGAHADSPGNYYIDVGVCGEQTAGGLNDQGGFGEIKLQSTGTTPPYTAFPTRQCYQSPVTITVTYDTTGDDKKTTTVTKTRALTLYQRYRVAPQVGILYSELHEQNFGVAKQDSKSVIVDLSDTGRGPEYVGALLFYGITRYLHSFGGIPGLYKGRDLVHENAMGDRVGFMLGVGLSAPSKRVALALTYELLPGVNLLGGGERVKVKELQGVSLGAEFADTADKIPTHNVWHGRWTFGVAIDLLYAKKLLIR